VRRDAPLSGVDGLIYRPGPNVTWLRDANHILVIDGERGETWSLSGREAALWDWLNLGYPYQKILEFLSLLMRASPHEAEKTLLTLLRDWQSEGIIHSVEEGLDGQSSHQRCL
jgi:hypothetical protein